MLPFLLGDVLAARVDLKADRQAGVLRVQAAHLEPGAPPRDGAGPLPKRSRAMAGWLGLSETVIMGSRPFEDALRACRGA